MVSGNTVMSLANDIKDELVQLWKRLHMQPELGYEEYKTSELIAEYLTELGLSVRRCVGKTGVVGVLEGTKPGNVVGLRADIDGLPVQEENEFEHKSVIDGRMHACGHDSHTAMLLGTAKLLSENRENLAGTVKFVFQPAEEYVTGAQAMIDDNVMHDPDIDLMLALHVIPDIPSGHIEIKSGAITSSTDEFVIRIIGKGGHGSNPQLAIDPIMTGAQLVTAIQTIVSRKISPVMPAAVSFGSFHGGNKSNTIPAAVDMNGTIRCQDEGVRRLIAEQLHQITKGICEASGTEYQLKINDLVPCTFNDDKLCREFIQLSLNLLDKDAIEIPSYSRTYGEDFSLFAQRVPSVLFYLGTRNEEKGCVNPLHSPVFKLDEDVLVLGVALFANFCFNR